MALSSQLGALLLSLMLCLAWPAPANAAEVLQVDRRTLYRRLARTTR